MSVPEGTADSNAVHRQITPDAASSEYDFLHVIADVEGTAIDELPSLYDEVDHFLELLFEEPPSKRAQMELTFTYHGYRITVDQAGRLKLVPVKESLE